MNTATYLKPSVHKLFNRVKERYIERKTDEMLRTWDVVTCHYCGKEISMFDGKLINNGQHFVCKEHQVN